MSAIPFLGGLAVISATTTLTLMAVSELQFQDRVVTDQAEFLATSVAQATFASKSPSAGLFLSPSRAALEAEARAQIDAFLPNPGEISSLAVAISDGSTIEVRLCRAAKFWLLEWLKTAQTSGQVCAEAKARAV